MHEPHHSRSEGVPSSGKGNVLRTRYATAVRATRLRALSNADTGDAGATTKRKAADMVPVDWPFNRSLDGRNAPGRQPPLWLEPSTTIFVWFDGPGFPLLDRLI